MADDDAPTALFEHDQCLRTDAKLARRALLQDWHPDRGKVRALVAKLSDAVLKGELDGKPLSPAAVIKGIEVLHSFDRLIVADEHHADRMDYHERALNARAANRMPGTVAGPKMGVSLETESGGKPCVVIYLPDNGRSAPFDDDLRPEDLLQD